MFLHPAADALQLMHGIHIPKGVLYGSALNLAVARIPAVGEEKEIEPNLAAVQGNLPRQFLKLF
jgi:hypothetical protein